MKKNYTELFFNGVGSNANDKMYVSIRKRFIRNTRLPINIEIEPYFSDRLDLFDSKHGCINTFKAFAEEVNKFESPELYMVEYSEVKQKAIDFINGTDEFKGFNSCNMQVYAVNSSINNISKKSIFKVTNNKQEFLSIDLAKANFNALKFVNKNIVGGYNSYKEFISIFTDSENMIESKHMREVIFGNCNPRRQTTVEKFLVGRIIEECLLKYIDVSDFESYTDDEIIIKLNKEIIDTKLENILVDVNKWSTDNDIELHVKRFKVMKVKNTKYYMTFEYKDGSYSDEGELRCVDRNRRAQFERILKGEDVTDSDLTFIVEEEFVRYVNSVNKIEFDD